MNNPDALIEGHRLIRSLLWEAFADIERRDALIQRLLFDNNPVVRFSSEPEAFIRGATTIFVRGSAGGEAQSIKPHNVIFNLHKKPISTLAQFASAVCFVDPILSLAGADPDSWFFLKLLAVACSLVNAAQVEFSKLESSIAVLLWDEQKDFSSGDLFALLNEREGEGCRVSFSDYNNALSRLSALQSISIKDDTVRLRERIVIKY